MEAKLLEFPPRRVPEAPRQPAPAALVVAEVRQKPHWLHRLGFESVELTVSVRAQGIVGFVPWTATLPQSDLVLQEHLRGLQARAEALGRSFAVLGYDFN